MNLTSLIRNLESQLKKTEKFARQYDAQAASLRKKLADVADIVGEKVTAAIASTLDGKKKGGMSAAKGRRRKLSKTHRTAIAAAQKARWEKRVEMCQLKITLVHSNPPIWRRLLAPGDMNLGLLHAVFQVAMGWTNSHLHHFIIGKETYADPRMDNERFMDEKPDRDEWKTSLAIALSKTQKPFVYEYDFGDSWEHLVEVEKTLSSNGIGKFARCLGGSRACPPEDCGGLEGYEDLLKIINDPNHEEHESMQEWLGGPFDPEAFDLEKTNKHLRKLKGPRITTDQLARVLMERDDYKEC